MENQLSSNHKFGSTCQGQYDEDNIPYYFPDLVFDNHAEDYVYSNTFFEVRLDIIAINDLTELEKGESTSREKNDYWQLDVTNGDLECWCLSVKGYRAARFAR